MGLINLVSHLPLPVRLFEPHPNPEKPGESPVLRSVVLPGKGHPDGRAVVTRGVDGEVFEAWKAANKNHPWLSDEKIAVVSDEDADKIETDPLMFGWEPGLDAVETDGIGEGSLAGDRSHLEVDMNAYSNVPNDDTPRSQTNGITAVVPGPQPMDPEPVTRARPEPHQDMSDAELEHATRPEPAKA